MFVGTPSLYMAARIMRLAIGFALILAIPRNKKPKVHFDAIASFKVMHSTARCRCGALRPRHDLYPAEEHAAALEAIASVRNKEMLCCIALVARAMLLHEMPFGQSFAIG